MYQADTLSFTSTVGCASALSAV